MSTSRALFQLRSLVAGLLLVSAATASLEARTCRRLRQIDAAGCQARIGPIAANDPDCDFSAVDCNGDGRPDLNIPFSEPGSAVTLSLEELCPGTGVATVRIRYISQTPGTRWIARDGSGSVVDSEAPASSGAPQWVQLDGNGDCIESIEVHAQETCIIAICWKCKADVDVEPAWDPEIALDENGDPILRDLPDSPSEWDVTFDGSGRFRNGLRGWEIAALVNKEVTHAGLEGTDAEGTAATHFESTRVRQIGDSGLDGVRERLIPGIGDSGRDGISWPLGIGDSGLDGVPFDGPGGGAGAGDDESSAFWLVTSAVTLPAELDAVTLPTEGALSILRLGVDPGAPGSDDLVIVLLNRQDDVADEDGEPVSTRVQVGEDFIEPSTGAAGATRTSTVPFRRGDVDASGEYEMVDAVKILSFLFLGHERPGCMDAADANDDGSVELTDSLRLLNWLFLGHHPPVAPFDTCGLDTTADTLDCGSYAVCSD